MKIGRFSILLLSLRTPLVKTKSQSIWYRGRRNVFSFFIHRHQPLDVCFITYKITYHLLA